MDPSNTGNHSNSPLSAIQLWAQAYAEAQKSKDWKTYCKVLGRAPNQPATETTSSLDAISKGLQVSKAKAEQSKDQPLVELSVACCQLLASIKDVGAAVTTLNPYASIAWSGIQFLLQLTLSNHEVKQLCLDSLARVAYLVSRYQTFDTVYMQDSHLIEQSRSTLEQSLLALYGSIISFQMALTITAGSKREKLRAAFMGVGQSKVQGALAAMQKCDDDVSNAVRLVDREVLDGHFKVIESSLDEIRGVVRNLQDMHLSNQHTAARMNEWLVVQECRQILDWISDFEYDTSHKKSEKTASGGTGGWLLENDIYVAWTKADRSTSLWLKGFMGSGKSCLTNLVIEQRLAASVNGDKHAVVYFYCDESSTATRDEMSDAGKIMRCLLRQLCTTQGERKLPRKVIESWNTKRRKSSLSCEEVVNLIISSTRDLDMLELIVDGLDESDRNVRRELIKSLTVIFQASPCRVKLFISGRPEVEPYMQALGAALVDIGKNNIKDIEFVINKRVEEATQDPALKLLYSNNSESQVQAVKDLLKEHAQGMFRWVQLSLNYLHRAKYYEAMKRRLEELPYLKDLFKLYDRIWDKMHEDVDTVDEIAITTLLTFAMYGNQYPRYKSLAEADFDPEEGRIHYPAYAALFAAERKTDCSWKLESILRLCPDFIEVEEYWYHGTFTILRVQHASVREYLVQKLPQRYSISAGHSFLAALCMDHWSLGGGEGAWAEYSFVWWGTHLHYVRRDAESRGAPSFYLEQNELTKSLFRFFGRTYTSSAFVAWSKYAETMTYFITGTSHGIAEASWTTSPPSSVAARISLKMPLSYIPRQELDSRSYHSGATTLHYAASKGQIETIKYLIEQGLDLNAVDERGKGMTYYLDLGGPYDHATQTLLENLLKVRYRPEKWDSVDDTPSMSLGRSTDDGEDTSSASDGKEET